MDCKILKSKVSELLEVILDIEAYEDEEDVFNAYWLLKEIRNLLPKEE